MWMGRNCIDTFYRRAHTFLVAIRQICWRWNFSYFDPLHLHIHLLGVSVPGGVTRPHDAFLSAHTCAVSFFPLFQVPRVWDICAFRFSRHQQLFIQTAILPRLNTHTHTHLLPSAICVRSLWERRSGFSQKIKKLVFQLTCLRISG